MNDQCTHTIQRIRQRYGIALSVVDYCGLCAAIKRRESFILHQLSPTTTAHLVAYRDELIPVVFDIETQQISTAMSQRTLRWIQQQFLNSTREYLDTKEHD